MIKKTIQNALLRAGYEVRKTQAAAIAGFAEPLRFDDLMNVYASQVDPETFYFIQVGANDGAQDDPLFRSVLRYGLRGLLVEPQPKVFAQLVENYSGVEGLAFEQAAIAPDEGVRTMYSYPEHLQSKGFNLSELASFDREHVLRCYRNMARRLELKQPPEELLVEIDVPCIRFETLLDRHGVERFDFLQIDTEGFDYEILKMVDLERFAPSIINYEHMNLSLPDKRECWARLRDHGYRCAIHGINTLAYKHDGP